MEGYNNISKAKHLIKVIRETESVYEPLYQKKCAEELLTIADIYPESYYHLAVFYSEHQDDDTASECIRYGIEHNEITCVVLYEVWNYYSNSSDRDAISNLLKYENASVFEIYKALADYHNDNGDTDKQIKYMCLAYDAKYPYYKPSEDLQKLKLVELYNKHQQLFKEYASERLYEVLQMSIEFQFDNASDEILFDAYILTKDERILNYLMNNRKYIPAFEKYVDVYGCDALIKNADANRSAMSLELPYIVPYNTKSLDVLKKMSSEGNPDAINEIARSVESGLLTVFDQEETFHYAMTMADSGLERFHWSVSETLQSLYESGKKDIFKNDYISYVYGRYTD